MCTSGKSNDVDDEILTKPDLSSFIPNLYMQPAKEITEKTK